MALTKPDTCTGCQLYDAVSQPIDQTKNVGILVVTGVPTVTELGALPFIKSGSSGRIVRRLIMDKVSQVCARFRMDSGTSVDLKNVSVAVPVAFTYAVRCASPNILTQKQIPVATIKQCRPMLLDQIRQAAPKVILAFGSQALEALGIQMKLSDVRGTCIDKTLNGVNCVVVPTFHEYALVKQPGLIEVMKRDIERAVITALGVSEEHEFDVLTPTSMPDILAELEMLLLKLDHAPQKLVVSIDTEDTSLTPYVPTDRVIAISMAYSDTVGLAFPYMHRDCPFTEVEMAQLNVTLSKIFSHQKLFAVMHNGKFDVQWLVHKLGLPLSGCHYDTQLAEHVIEEDKKGEYSLKDLAVEKIPWVAKYEGDLHQRLKEVQAVRDKEFSNKEAEWTASRNAQFMDIWLALSDDERISKLAAWVTKGYLTLRGTDVATLATPKRRKSKTNPGITKSYVSAISRLLNSVPEEELGVALPPRPNHEEETRVTFEDVPLPVLLKYAAIDAVVTRAIAKLQGSEFRKDEARIASKINSSATLLPTQTLRWGYDNITIPLCNTLANMEYGGVKMDRDKIKQYDGILSECIEKVLDELYTEVGRKFNPDSAELGKILFDEMKMPVLKTSEKTGDPSTDAETLKELAETCDAPFLTTLLEYRKMTKVQSTYLRNWLARSDIDGRLHCSFNQTGTATLRLSSSNPKRLGL